MGTLTVDEAKKLIGFTLWVFYQQKPQNLVASNYWLENFEPTTFKQAAQRVRDELLSDQFNLGVSLSTEPLKIVIDRLENNFKNPEYFAFWGKVRIVHAAVLYLRLDVLRILLRIGTPFDDVDGTNLLSALVETASKKHWVASPEFSLETLSKEHQALVLAGARTRVLEVFEFLLKEGKLDPHPSSYRYLKRHINPLTEESKTLESTLRGVRGPFQVLNIPGDMWNAFSEDKQLFFDMLDILLNNGFCLNRVDWLINKQGLWQSKCGLGTVFTMLFELMESDDQQRLLEYALKNPGNCNALHRVHETGEGVVTHTLLTWVMLKAKRKDLIPMLRCLLEGGTNPNTNIHYRIASEFILDKPIVANIGRGDWERNDFIPTCFLGDATSSLHEVTDAHRRSFTPLHFLVYIIACSKFRYHVETLKEMAMLLIQHGADVRIKCIVPNIVKERYNYLSKDISKVPLTPLQYAQLIIASATTSQEVKELLTYLSNVLEDRALELVLFSKGPGAFVAAAAAPPAKRPRR